jgi:hypothetical protein
MSDHESALQKMLIARLASDATVKALLGDPARIWDEPPASPTWPHLLIGRSESRLVAAEGCGTEHVLSLNCVSRFGGSEEAKAICAAVRARLHEAALTGDGVRTVSLRVTFSDVFGSGDLRRTYGVMRVRAITEDI